MKIPEEVLNALPAAVRTALAQFTPDELGDLFAAYDHASGDFIGIGFCQGPDQTFCKYADPRRAGALQVMEDHYRAIESLMRQEIEAQVIQAHMQGER